MYPRLPALSAQARATLWRSLHTLNATRVVIALVLLGYLSAGSHGPRAAGDPLYLQVCALYLALAIVFVLMAVYRRRHFLAQLMAQIGCDLAIISLLYLAGGGMRSGLAILYLFPLAGMAILAPLLLALFCAALVALFILAEGTYQFFMLDSQPAMLQSGLFGAAFFAAVLVVNRMAARLLRQEELAHRRDLEIHVQQAVNRLVMANVGDGVLVLDEDGRVRDGNPAARQMLGLSGPELRFLLSAHAALAPLAQAYADWRADPARATAFVTIKPPAGGAPRQAAHLTLSFAAVDTGGEAGRNVIFLRDVTAIELQAQQLKLASMGRLTASIAHEVRNPLSAIAHATALLEEDLDSPVQRRLLNIVGDNVSRVDRMVEDILRLSRKARTEHQPLAPHAFLAELKAEFDGAHKLDPAIVHITAPPGATVRFDPLHLREVVLNLLNNALRYASGQPASIRLHLLDGHGGRMELHVQDDGPGIPPEVRAHLFEPFHTTSSKGTGLGLYLARELCLNNDATLDYEYRYGAVGPLPGQAAPAPASSGRFVITFAHPLAWPPER
ncbi:two-component system sensor histidine kinase NtrB [Oxalobacteraceae bacterium A2-2]